MIKTFFRLMANCFSILLLPLLLIACEQSSVASSLPFVSDATSGGEIYDGLDVGSVRYAKHAEFERLVFDVVNWEGFEDTLIGQPADSTGHFTIKPEVLNIRYAISFDGFRAFSAEIPNLITSKLILSFILRKGEEYGDDSSIPLLLTFKKEACYRAFTLKNPDRIVIDVKICSTKQDKPSALQSQR